MDLQTLSLVQHDLCATLLQVNIVGMAVQKRIQTRIARMTAAFKLTHPSYICIQVVRHALIS